jgi:hypothetical protein
MSKLIEELEKEHAVIVETLSKVKKFGITSSEGQNTLIAAKNGFLAHLKKEDDQLYPFLNKAAESNAALKQTLEMFAKDMDAISKTALDFFDKYSIGGSGIEFAMDFGALSAKLSQRIFKEESTIYKKYVELKK